MTCEAIPPATPKASAIIAETCEAYDVPRAILLGRSRRQKFGRARQEVMYRLYVETNLSLSQIGGKIGGRNHATISKGVISHCLRAGLPVPRRMSKDYSPRDWTQQRQAMLALVKNKPVFVFSYDQVLNECFGSDGCIRDIHVVVEMLRRRGHNIRCKPKQGIFYTPPKGMGNEHAQCD